MSLIIFALILLAIIAVAVGIGYYIPATPPFAWLKWAIPVAALIIVLIMLIQKLGVA